MCDDSDEDEDLEGECVEQLYSHAIRLLYNDYILIFSQVIIIIYKSSSSYIR